MIPENSARLRAINIIESLPATASADEVRQAVLQLDATQTGASEQRESIYPSVAGIYTRVQEKLTPISRFFRAQPPASPLAVIKWWEARRIPYNAIVGVTGFCTIVIFFVTALISDWLINEPIGLPEGFGILFAMFGVLAYGIMANVCFTLGWICELLLRNWGVKLASWIMPLAFALGVIFSVILTMLPAILIVIIAAVAIIGRLSGLAPPPVEQSY